MLKLTLFAALGTTALIATPAAAQRHGRTVVIERTVVEDAPGWDRRALHGYGFRQTPRGARLSLSGDVLFATDSDVLRPGAMIGCDPLLATFAPTRASASRSMAIPTAAGRMRTTRTCPSAGPRASAPRSTRWA